MGTKKYVARIVEMNNFFEYFPKDPATDRRPKKLADDKLVDILEFGCPPKWQKEMIIQDFDSTKATIPEFVHFCERLERAHHFVPDATVPTNDRKKSSHSNNRKRKPGNDRDFNRNKKADKFASKNSPKYCMYHGKDKGHNSEECTVLKEQARKMRGQHNAQHPCGKKDCRAKKEPAAMISQVTETVFAQMSPVKKRQITADFPTPVSDDTENVIAAFDQASISEDSKQSVDSSISLYRSTSQNSGSSSTSSASSKSSTSSDSKSNRT